MMEQISEQSTILRREALSYKWKTWFIDGRISVLDSSLTIYRIYGPKADPDLLLAIRLYAIPRRLTLKFSSYAKKRLKEAESAV